MHVQTVMTPHLSDFSFLGRSDRVGDAFIHIEPAFGHYAET